MKMSNIYGKLLDVQSRLNAPKNQRNNFGNYNYRSCEDIVEAVKPLLKENKLILRMDDSLECVGNRYYIKATATVYDCEGAGFVSASALAREEETRKGMDVAQITGTASSYARKYALNGLFAIDDAKDSDTNESRVESDERVNKEHERILKEFMREVDRTGVPLEYFLKQGKVEKADQLRYEDMCAAIKAMKEKPDKKK